MFSFFSLDKYRAKFPVLARGEGKFQRELRFMGSDGGLALIFFL
jgi:hypothetical protein